MVNVVFFSLFYYLLVLFCGIMMLREVLSDWIDGFMYFFILFWFMYFIIYLGIFYCVFIGSVFCDINWLDSNFGFVLCWRFVIFDVEVNGLGNIKEDYDENCDNDSNVFDLLSYG